MHCLRYFIFLLFLTGTLASPFSQTASRRCAVKTMIGTVKIRRGGTVNWIDAKPRMTLKERDAVRTFIESEAELETSEGSLIKVGENSTL